LRPPPCWEWEGTGGFRAWQQKPEGNSLKRVVAVENRVDDEAPEVGDSIKSTWNK
jgi:hypothetical protein